MAAENNVRQYERVALIIGNSDYEPDLTNPVRDAALLTRKLEGLGYAIVGGAAPKHAPERGAGENKNAGGMYALIKAFEDQIMPGGTAVIYYAGHAMQIADRNYLLPVNAKLDGDNPLLELVELRPIILRAAEKAGSSGTVIVFLDACRDNPFKSQMPQIAEKVVSRSVVVEHGQPGPVATTRGGLATLKMDRSDRHARTFVAFATAPGDVAFDGHKSAENSPFASALGRYLDIRGLEIEDFYNRVATDVLDEVARMNRYQDPWSETNLNQTFFLNPRSSLPILFLGIAGLLAGLLICLLAFSQGKIASLSTAPWIWGLGLIFGLVPAAGAWFWGSRKPMDVAFAFIGPGFGFALAHAILSMVPQFPSEKLQQLTSPWLLLTSPFGLVTVAGCLVYLVGTAVVWTRRWGEPGYRIRRNALSIINALLSWTLPIIVAFALLSLQFFLAIQNAFLMAFALFAILAGVFYAISAALGCRLQQGLFRGFGPFTGCITVGLLMAVLFVVYAWLSRGMTQEASQPLLILLGTLWHGILGAQLGYCFAYYVPDHRRIG